MSDQPAQDPPKDEGQAPPVEEQKKEETPAEAAPAQAQPSEGEKPTEGVAKPEEEKKADGEQPPPAEGQPTGESKPAEGGEAPKVEAKEEKKEGEAAKQEAAEQNKVPEGKADPEAPAAEGEGEEGEEVAEEESVHTIQMGIDEFYPEDHVEKEIEDSAIPANKVTKFLHCQGIESMKRYNLSFLDEKHVIYATGNTYQILNIETKEKRVFFGHDTDGVGSICVHPSKKYFAVAEKGDNWPCIYIYEYPSLKLYRIMRRGTEKAYSHIEFDRHGDMLASVGSYPDFTLTVWNWMAQKVILKAKAFSQEVYKVCFSPYHDGVLTSSGTGHIRFWKMASTFTGLKLQGEIGKFGQLELSDVTGFRELPDGKVLSGTEYGTLMLWEGNLIKAHLVLDIEKKTPVHDGHIEFVTIEGDKVITAGGDGYIKYWDLHTIDMAEGDEVPEVAIEPLNQIQIKDPESGLPAYITHMIKGIGFWLAFDANGKIWKVMLPDQEFREITHFHSGGVAGLSVSSEANAAVTLGTDGVVKLWDFIKGQEYYQKRYEGGGSALDWMPRNELNMGRVVATGYQNGIVRVLALNEKNFDILQSFKAHDSTVVKLKFSPDGQFLVSAAEDGTLFFFDSKNNDLQDFPPICMVNIGSKINDLCWDGDGKKILVGCANGYVYELDKPDKSKVDNKESYEVELPMKSWKIKMMEFQMKKNQKKDEEELEKRKRMRLRGELPMEEEDEDEDWDPEQIHTVSYAHDSNNRFIVTSEGPFTGWYYICSFESERPLQAIDFPKKQICSLYSPSPSKDFIITGLEDGSVQIRHCEFQNNVLQVKMHDGHNGGLRGAVLSKNENYLITAGNDGLIYVHAVSREAVKSAAQDIELSDNILFDEEQDGVERLQLTKELKITREMNQDADPEAYSIQQSKLRTEEDHRLRLAEEKKQGVRQRVQKLRDEFSSLVKKNKSQSDWIQMTEDEFNIDPSYFEMLETRNNDSIEEAKKEVAWHVEWHTVALNKLKNKFYDVLEYEKFTVKGIKNEYFVTTFRVQKMSEKLSKDLDDFKQMLESEFAGKGLDDEFQSIDSDGRGPGNEESRRDQSITKLSIGAGQTHHAQTQQQTQGGKQKTEAEKKREERKVAREMKKKKLEKLEKKEAKYSAEDPEERKKIENAKQTYGDYKLKMSRDYVVPENQRVNASKKRQQMVLLEGSIHKLKVDFNKRVEDLKFRKKDIISLAENVNGRLKEINEELGVEESLFMPSIDEEVEYPEKYFDVTDKEIKDFVKLKVRREKEKNVKKSMFSSKKEQAQEEEVEDVPDEDEIAAQKAKKASDEEEKKRKEMQVVERKGKKTQESEIENEVKKIREIQLMYEKEQLTNQINEEIKRFDTDVEELQKEKYRLESDLKQAEMKLITFYEELILLNSMESKDRELTEMLKECRQNKGNILKEINEISRKLKEKKKEIEEIKEREDDLMRRFHELCPEGSQFYDEILAFFKKIIKRRKRTEKMEKNEDGDDDDEDMDFEDEEEEDDEDEDENDAAYKFNQEDHKIDDIEKLREDRMDLYDEKVKIESFINDLENQRKKLEMNEKRIKNDLQNTEEEIQDFQKDKMSKLNQLVVSIVLRTKQIQNLYPDEELIAKWQQIHQQEIEANGGNPDEMSPNNTMMNHSHLNAHEGLHGDIHEPDYRGYVLPENVTRSVLFTRSGLLGLIDRKRELDEEHRSNLRLYRECAEDTKRMRKEIKEGCKKREEADRHYKEKQMLRFGDLVDLDSLEVSGPSLAVTDLQEKFRKKERQCISNISEAEAELEKTQRDLTQAIKNNTNLLNLIIQLGKDQLDLNKTLDSTNKAIFADEDDEVKNTLLKQKEGLRQMLEVQASEIETLKTEIALYKRKGGHIYTKVTTNRRAGGMQQNLD